MTRDLGHSILPALGLQQITQKATIYGAPMKTRDGESLTALVFVGPPGDTLSGTVYIEYDFQESVDGITWTAAADAVVYNALGTANGAANTGCFQQVIANPAISTTLAVAITTTTSTTVVLTSSSGVLPGSVLIIGSEDLLVEAVWPDGQTVTATRGYNSTTAATHVITTAVTGTASSQFIGIYLGIAPYVRVAEVHAGTQTNGTTTGHYLILGHLHYVPAPGTLPGEATNLVNPT